MSYTNVFTVEDAHAAPPPSGNNSNQMDVTASVICNVIKFVQNLGIPIMTAVIIGSSVMAIFGRLAWPAIMVLVVFTGIFFGAGKVVSVFTNNLGTTTGVTEDKYNCKY